MSERIGFHALGESMMVSDLNARIGFTVSETESKSPPTFNPAAELARDACAGIYSANTVTSSRSKGDPRSRHFSTSHDALPSRVQRRRRTLLR
jgi:hypothetical protein